ncbi:MAG: YkoF family thiamine/hydroxymethylpyrimidine-binding protein, partial [Gammaproteobacteria bacterium]
AELSLYPLETDYLPRIVSFIQELAGSSGIEIVVNQMSTQLRGEFGDVARVINQALEGSFSDGHAQVLVVKYLNADLPISEEPDVDLA